MHESKRRRTKVAGPYRVYLAVRPTDLTPSDIPYFGPDVEVVIPYPHELQTVCVRDYTTLYWDEVYEVHGVVVLFPGSRYVRGPGQTVWTDGRGRPIPHTGAEVFATTALVLVGIWIAFAALVQMGVHMQQHMGP